MILSEVFVNSTVMKKMLLVFAVSIAFVSAAFSAEVITYPAPITEKMQSGYKIFANGKPVDVYKALSPDFQGGEYYFGYFDFSGDVEIKVVFLHNFKTPPELFPKRDFKVEGNNTIVFKADKPFQTCILRTDRENDRETPLIVFGNPIETDRPSKNDPNVVYFGAGVHVVDKIELKDNQTLYIAGGAVVKGVVSAIEGKNITVRGRGILSGELRERFSSRFVLFKACENVKMEGVILKDTMTWTLVFEWCDKVEVDNVKICCSRMINDDGIDICNSSNVVVRNSFVRAQDDIIAIKGMWGKKACENILVEDSILWTDRANTFRYGFECEAAAMRNITVRNCHIPFYSKDMRPPEHFWSNAIIWLQPANEMPMNNINFENLVIRSNGSDIIMLSAAPRITNFRKSQKVGKVYDCTFKNIRVEGKKGNFNGLFYFKGFDATHDVKNFTFENITYFGEKITENSPSVRIEGSNVSNIKFLP